MMKGTLTALLLVACSLATAQPIDFAVQESLRFLPPNMRFREMHRQGLIDRSPVSPTTDSSGLRLVGKWGGGPSVKVTGRDSLVFLSRGSEVVAISFADSANPEVPSYMQVNGLVSRSVLVGDRLYVGSTGSDPKYIDMFDVADPANPVLLGTIQTSLNDIAVEDTLVYAIGDDSLKVYSFADPENPWLVGACRDSGYDIAVCNGYAYLGDRRGLYVVDVRDPASPQRVASWGTDIISVTVRNSICCLTTENDGFLVYDVSNPALPEPMGALSIPAARDLYQPPTCDTVACTSYSHIVSLSDPAHPRLISQMNSPGWDDGVSAVPDLNRALIADHSDGVVVVDISDPAVPVVDTMALSAGLAVNLSIAGNRLYIGGYNAGFAVLDVTDPALPTRLGGLDYMGLLPTCLAVAGQDSFAYVSWEPGPQFRSLDVSDPGNPVLAGGDTLFARPEDMVLRDTFVYCAMTRRLQVVNVARPREPELVGSCNLPGDSRSLVVEDTVAYVAQGSGGLYCVGISDPETPSVLGSWAGRTSGVSVVDTVALVAGPYTGCC